MQKRRSIKLKLSDKIIIFLSISVSLASLFLFVMDLTRVQIKDNESSIAKVTFKEKTVQRKFSDRLIWDRLRTNSKLYSGDTIRTGDSSEISLELLDETQVSVYSNTMVQLFESENGTTIAMSENAEINVKTNDVDNLFLQLNNGSMIKVENDSEFVTHANNGKVGFQITRGEATLINENGELNKLSNDNYLIDENGKIILSPICVIFPTLNEQIVNYESTKYRLNFQYSFLSEEENKKVDLEIAKDKNFNYLVFKKELENVTSSTIELDEGKFFYRISLVDKSFSLTGKFEIINAKFSKLIRPINKEIIYYSKIPSVRFIWENIDIAYGYLLEISKNIDMKDPVYKQKNTNNSIVIDKLTEGLWYWRVSPRYGLSDNTYITSDIVYSFTLMKEDGKKSFNIKSPPNGIETIDSVVFAWEDDEVDGTYIVKIADNPELENPKMNIVTKNPYVKTQLEETDSNDKQWYWSLEKVSPEGKVIENSDVRFFTQIDYEKQKLLSPINEYVLSVDEVRKTIFSWTRNNDLIKNIIQFSRDSNFERIEVERSTDLGEIKEIDLTTGEWFWRVKRYDEDDSSLAFYSDPWKIIVIDKLPPPKISDSYNEKVFIITKEKPIQLDWNFDNTLKPYIDDNELLFKITVFDNAKVIFTKDNLKQKSVQFYLNEVDIEKKYQWSVNAYVNSSDKSSFIDGKIISSVINIRTPQKITLQTPSDGKLVDGLNAYLNGTSFKWQSIENLVESQFVLEKKTGTTQEIIKTISNPEKELTISSLNEGNYIWYVKGRMVNDFDVTSKDNNFTIGKIKKLNPVTLIEPKSRKLFDEQYFRNNREVKFSWDIVKDADQYNFKIEREDGTIIIDKFVNKETTYVFEDINLFDIGESFWSVKAIRKDKNGKVIQSSDISKSSFIIDIPLPEKLKIQKKGLFYAY